MKKLILITAFAMCVPFAHAADNAQSNLMKTCNVEAKDKKGDERKAFMKECLAAKPAADPATATCEKSAADKKLHGAAAKSHIKKCMADSAASAPK